MSDRLFVATRKGLFEVRKGARSWGVANAWFVGDHCPMVLPDPRNGAVFVAVHHEHFGDRMHVLRNGGGFEECAVPKYPEKPKDFVDDVDPVQQKPVPWALKLVWSLEADGPEGEGLWCGTIPGGLFRSTDGARSWELVRPLWDHPARRKWFGGGAEFPGIHSICVDPRDPRRVAVAVSCAGVWMTEDGGATWANRAEGMRAEYMPPEQQFDPDVQDPHRMVQCRARPDVYWAQHHNGIFRTTNGCREWREITDVQPSAFGFAVAAHPHDGDTAWFVPAIKDERRVPVDGRLVVTRTQDGGKSFEALADGLPGEHAYDLVYRHGLDVDATGDRLAMGSTTGSLWVSEDGGGRWAHVSAHLPPVYAVRFA